MAYFPLFYMKITSEAETPRGKQNNLPKAEPEAEHAALALLSQVVIQDPN